METIQCIKERRSVRKFKDTYIPKETMEEIVATAAYAPSWKNTQITRYTLIQNDEIIQKIGQEATLNFKGNMATIANTKNFVVVSYIQARSGFERDGSYTTSKKGEWQMFDAGIATQTFCLAAHDLGIGSVVLGIFDEDKVAEIIGLPENETVAALLAIGYPDQEPVAPKRKDVDVLLRTID